MKRHFRRLRSFFFNFKIFLFYVIEHNQCNKYAMNHFKHNADDYMFQKDYEVF